MSNLDKRTVSIIIVNFNSGHFLSDCLSSLEKIKSEAKIKVWVVDNISSDDSVSISRRKFPNVNFIENKENIGFAKANNEVVKKVNSEYVLFLNPDVQVFPGVISQAIDFFENNQNVGVVTPKVELSDGSLDWASHRGLPTPLASFLYFLGDDSLYHLNQKDFNSPHTVDAVSGAFLMTKTDILRKVNFFDEDYFLYGEDLDLCYKIQKVGYKIFFLPQIKVIHFKGVSSGLKNHSQEVTTATKRSRQKALNSFYETMKIFYEKHLAEKYPFFINWIVYLAIDFKKLLSEISQRV